MPTIAEKYGLVKPRQTIAQKYGLTKPLPPNFQFGGQGTTVPAQVQGNIERQLSIGAMNSILGNALVLGGIVPELPKGFQEEAPKNVSETLLRGAGALGPDLPFFALSGGVATGLGAGRVLSTAAAFGGPGVLREATAQQRHEGKIDPVRVAKEGAKEAALGAAIGGVGKLIPGTGLAARGGRFGGEVGVFAEFQALEEGEITPSKDQLAISALFLGGLKGFNAALGYAARKARTTPQEMRQRVGTDKDKLVKEITGKDFEIAQRRADAFTQKGADIGITRTPQEAQKAEEVTLPPTPSTPARIVPPDVKARVEGKVAFERGGTTEGKEFEFSDYILTSQLASDALRRGDMKTHKEMMAKLSTLGPKRTLVEGGPTLGVSKEGRKLAEETAPEKQVFNWETTDEISRDLDLPKDLIDQMVVAMGKGKVTALFTKLAREDAARIENTVKKMKTVDNDATIQLFKDVLREERKPLQAVSSEAGRLLQKHQQLMIPSQARDKILAMLEKMPKERQIELAERLRKLDPTDPYAFRNFLKSITPPAPMDYVYELWYNSILSGPPTHLVNTISNTVWQAFQTPLRALSAVVDVPVSKLQGRKREFYASEIAPLWIGYKHGIKKGTSSMLKLLRTGEVQEDMTKFGYEMGGALEAFGRSPSKTARKIAPLVGLPSRLLRASDLFFKSIAFEGDLTAFATRQGIKQGLRGEALAKRVAQLMEKPTPEMMRSAKKFSEFTTYTDAPGKISAGIMNLRNQVPGGRFLVPFVRTIGNLMRRGMELTPGLGLVPGVAINASQLRGPALSETIAKQLAGFLMLYGAVKYLDGELTGAMPQNKAEREQWYRIKKLPWSIKFADGDYPLHGLIGDVQFQFRRAEPFNMPFAMLAIIGDTWRDKGELPTEEKLVKVALGLARNLMDGSYLSQTSDILSAIESGERGSTAIRRITQRQVASFVPYSSLLRSLTKGVEASTTGEALVHQPETTREAIEAGIPFLSSGIPVKPELFGRPAKFPGGTIQQFLPYKAVRQEANFVENELVKIKYAPGMPGKKLDGEELTRDEYKRLVAWNGNAATILLNRIMRSPLWQRLNSVQKRGLAKRVFLRTGDDARNQMRRFLIEKKGLGVPQ